jgi:hypothetical protein
MSTIRVACWTWFFLASAGSICFGRTWTVDQNGGGDFVLLSDACNAATSGDTIAVHPGDYEEPNDHQIYVQGKALVICGTGLQPEDVSVSLYLELNGCHDVALEKIRFHGHDRPVVVRQSTLVIRNCTFEDNWACANCIESGAISIIDMYCQCDIEDCAFLNNRQLYAFGGPDEYIGGGAVSAASTINIRRCWFEGNSSTSYGGAVWAYRSNIEDCVFLHNTGYGAAALLSVQSTITRCTLYANEVTGGVLPWLPAAIVDIDDSPAGGVFNCIVANTVNGWGFTGGWEFIECSDLWATELGPCQTCMGENNNISSDPLFCDPEQGDFTLSATSPCLPGQVPGSPCSLIGARGVGCGEEIPVQVTSWGAIKAMYK